MYLCEYQIKDMFYSNYGGYARSLLKTKISINNKGRHIFHIISSPRNNPAVYNYLDFFLHLYKHATPNLFTSLNKK